MGTTDNRDEGEYAGDTPTTGPLTDWEEKLMRSTELDVSGLDPISVALGREVFHRFSTLKDNRGQHLGENQKYGVNEEHNSCAKH